MIQTKNTIISPENTVEISKIDILWFYSYINNEILEPNCHLGPEGTETADKLFKFFNKVDDTFLNKKSELFQNEKENDDIIRESITRSVEKEIKSWVLNVKEKDEII